MSFSHLYDLPDPASNFPGTRAVPLPEDEQDEAAGQEAEQPSSTPALPISKPSAAAWAAQARATSAPAPVAATTAPATTPSTSDNTVDAGVDAPTLPASTGFPVSKPVRTSTLPAAGGSTPTPSPDTPSPGAERINYRMYENNPVLREAFAPEIFQERQLQSQDAYNAEVARREQARQATENARRDKAVHNADMRKQSQLSGVRTVMDADGFLQPLQDDQGRTLYHPHVGEVQYDKKTGAPFQDHRNEFGETTRTNPDANAPIGPNTDKPKDPQLYRQNKFQKWQPIGHVDELAGDESQPPNVRAIAANWQQRRGLVMAGKLKEAAQDQVLQAQMAHVGAQTQLQQVGQQISDLTPQYNDAGQPTNDAARDATAAGQPPQKASWFSSPVDSEATTAAKARNADRAKQLAPLQQQQQELQAQLGSAKEPGPLTLAYKAAQQDATLTGHMVGAGNYAKLVDQRRAILKAEGKSEDSDPLLTNILQQQKDFGVKVQDARQQRDQTLQQASDAGHDLSPWFAPTLSPEEAARTTTQAATWQPGGEPAGSPAVRDWQPGDEVPRTAGALPSSLPAKSEVGAAASKTLQGITPPAGGDTLTDGVAGRKDTSLDDLSEGLLHDKFQPPPTFTLAQRAKNDAGQVAAGVLNTPFEAGRAFWLSAAAATDVSTPEQRNQENQQHLGELQSTLASFEKRKDNPRYKSDPTFKRTIDEAVSRTQASITTRQNAKPESPLSPGDEKKAQFFRDLSTQARGFAEDEKSTIERVKTNVGVDPKQAGNTDSRIFGGLGALPKMLLPGGIGPVLMLGDTKSSAYDAEMEKLRPQVENGDLAAHDAERAADTASTVKSLEQLPVLAAYGVNNQVVGTAVKSLLARTQISSPLWRAAIEGTGALGANVATSTGVRAVEAGLSQDPKAWNDVLPSWESVLSGDLPFAMLHAGHAYGGAHAEAGKIAEGQADLNAKAARLAPIGADNAADHLTVPLPADAPSPAASNQAVADNFAQRNPDAPKIDPAVVARAREFSPHGAEQAAADALTEVEGRIQTAESALAKVPKGDGEQTLRAQNALASAYQTKADLVNRSDARLSAVQQISALPDAPAPVDAEGNPDGPAAPARDRETAGALLKVASGFQPEDLTTAEQARLTPAKGESPLTRKAGDGSTILTDVGRQALATAAPAAGKFIQGSEAQELRSRAQKPSIPGDVAPSGPRTASDDAPPATQTPSNQSRAASAKSPKPPADEQSGSKEASEPRSEKIPSGADRQPPAKSSEAGAGRKPTFATGDTSQARANDFLEGEHSSAVRFGPEETAPSEVSEHNPAVRLPDGSRVFYDAERHGPEDFGPDAKPEGAENLSTEKPGGMSKAAMEDEKEISAPRQPNTVGGQHAARMVEKLTAKQAANNGFLTEEDRTTLSGSRAVVERDLNRQVLGPNPKPMSAHGIDASDRLDRFRGAQAAGAQLSAGEHAEARRLVDVLENDFTKQRLAREAAPDEGRQERAGTQQKSGKVAPELMAPEEHARTTIDAYDHLRPEVRRARAQAAAGKQKQAVEGAFAEQRPVHVEAAKAANVELPVGYVREGDRYTFAPLAVGDIIQGGKRRYRVTGLGDERHIEITAPSGKTLKMGRKEALASRVERASEEAEPTDPAAEEQARREHEAELLRQAHAGIEDAGGVELLDAVRQVGGIPVPGSDPTYRGELGRVQQATQAAHLAGYGGTFNPFRKSALTLDQLTNRLREMGFSFETPGEMLNALERRITSKQPQYSFAAHNEAQSGMAGSEAYFRRSAPPPRTPEELLPVAQKYREMLGRVSPVLAKRLEIIRKSQLASLWRGHDRPPGDIQAAHLDGTLYLVHEALEANPEHLTRVNLLHEAAHSYERALPENQRRGLQGQWQAEMKSGKSPLHGPDGKLRADVDQRAATNFSEWLAERVAWENAAWLEGKTATGGPVARFAQGLRDLFLKVFRAVRPGQGSEDQITTHFREWMEKGGEVPDGAGLDGQPAQATVRNWLRRFGRGGQVRGEDAGQSTGERVGSKREEAPSQAPLDSVIGTRSWLEDTAGKNDGGAGGAMDAVPPPDGRNLGTSGLEAGARSDARERTGTAAGGGSERSTGTEAARTRGLAVKKYVGDVAAAAVDVGSSGQRGDGISPTDLAARASKLLRLTPAEAQAKGYTSSQVEALQRIRQQIPLIPRERLVQSIDADQVSRWHGDDASEASSGGQRDRIEHHLRTGTLSRLFGHTQGEFADHMRGIVAKQKAGGIVPRLEVIGVGNEGAAFRDRQSGLIYKFHPGTEAASAYGITRVEPQPDGTTKVSVDKVPLTDAIRRYERQNAISVSIPTEVAGVTPDGILVTKQREMATNPKTTYAEIEEMMAGAGGRRVKVPNEKAIDPQTWAVPDGEGNWFLAADLKPDNVLREKGTGTPRLTDGILAPITPEVLRDNPQLAEYPATHPEAQFARRRTADTGTGDLFAPRAEAREEERPPITGGDALRTAKAQLAAHMPMLRRMGVRNVQWTTTRAASGVEIGEDGILRIHAPKLAQSLAAVRDIQAKKGLPGTPEDWFARVLLHEGIHAADAAVAREKGQSLKQRYDALPDGAMPKGWEQAGRKTYGPDWDGLESWQKKTEFSRMILEGRWQGKVTEQVYRVLRQTMDYLKRVAGFDGVDPRFQAHVAEVEARLEAAREQPGARTTEGAGDWQRFGPESGTLGIPRPDIPQVDAEHRGAMANFLKAQGMPVSEGETLPGNLRPSQAEFSLEKVAKAGAIRQAGESAPRRILESNDGYVIDGHHQCLDRLQHEPDKPMPTLRIDAPAQDILAKIHEFPSAGMDGPPRLRNGERQGDLLSNQTEDLRLVGEEGTDHAVRQRAREQAERESAEAAARQEEAQGALFARRTLPETVQTLKDELAAREPKDRISYGVDAAETRPAMLGRQAGNVVRGEFGSEKELQDPNSQANQDLRAMPFVIEAWGDWKTLAADMAKVQASSDPDLAAKYAPVLRYALANLARLDGKKASYEAIANKQTTIERRNGINSKRYQDAALHVLDLPNNQKHLEPLLLGKEARYAAHGQDFENLADAIQAGYAPRSTNLADLLENRIAAGQRMVQSRRLFSELKSVPAPGDAAGRSIIADPEKVTLPDGTTESRPPAGYVSVNAAGVPLMVHKRFAGLFQDLYGDSAWRQNTAGRAMLAVTALAKHGTLMLDTFHGGRMLWKQVTSGGGLGWQKPVSLLEHNDADLARMVAAGDIPQSVADYAKANRPVAEELMKAGLNVGRMSDNLWNEAHGLLSKLGPIGRAADSGLGKVNHLIFAKITLGGMLSSGINNFKSNLRKYPELSREQVARKTAYETNLLFGNLGRQGFLKSKTAQDTARVLFLAPQWVESQLRNEVGAYAQLGKTVPDALRGKLRMGGLARQMAVSAVALLAANQVINWASRGQGTWDNKEEGHKFDAWLPGGKHGFFFSPLAMASEYAHTMLRYHEGGAGLDEGALRIATNKLSPGARGLYELLSGHDMTGHAFPDTKTRVRAGIMDMLPSPMPVSGTVEKDPRGTAGEGPVTSLRDAADKVLSPLGYRVNRQAGSVTRQVFQSLGIKADPAPSASRQMRDLARPYRPEAFHSDRPSPYSQLRRAVEDGDEAGVKDELRALHKDGHDLAEVGKRVFQIKEDGTVGPALFTGSKVSERLLMAGLTAEQRKLYAEAQKEHEASARFFQQAAGQMRSELAPGKSAITPQGMAISALKKGNTGLVRTLIEQGQIQPEELPALKRQAKQKSEQHPAKASAGGKSHASATLPASFGRGRPITDLWKTSQQVA